MIGHLREGNADAWLMIEPARVQVVGDWSNGTQVLRDADQGGPSFYCRTWHTTGGRDRPTVHTVTAGDADMYEEVLETLGFHFEQPEGIELRKDESGVFRGFYA
jgi:hypothetical protein